MDLVKTDPRRIATLILNGKLELGEVPARRRPTVTDYIEELKRIKIAKREKAKAQKRVKAAKKKAKPKVKEEVKEDASPRSHKK